MRQEAKKELICINLRRRQISFALTYALNVLNNNGNGFNLVELYSINFAGYLNHLDNEIFFVPLK